MFKSLAASVTPDDKGLIVDYMIRIFGINWKTSFSGLVTMLAVVLLALSGLLEALAKVFEADKRVSLWIAIMTAVIGFFLAICRGWVGLIQLDSGVQAVKLAGAAEPVGVASHEVPNVPLPAGAKVVKDGEGKN